MDPKQIEKMLMDITEKIILLENKIDNIDIKLGNIQKTQTDINDTCNKMENHVDFVENTYSAVRAPLNFLKKNIDKIMGNAESNDLPQLNYNESNDIKVIQCSDTNNKLSQEE